MNAILSENDITKVQDILINQLAVSRDQLTPEAKLEADLCADSLDIIEITMALEETFDLTIPDEEAGSVHTVGDIYRVLASFLQQAGQKG